jgi:hypothetical protein
MLGGVDGSLLLDAEELSCEDRDLETVFDEHIDHFRADDPADHSAPAFIQELYLIPYLEFYHLY